MLPLDIFNHLKNKKIILYDIDNTLIDVSERYRMSLRESGLDPNINIRKIPPSERNRFWRVFLSNKYMHLDKPNQQEIKKLNKKYDEGYGIILITGRPETLRKDTLEQLRRFAIKYHALIMRPKNNREPDKIYKVRLIREMVNIGLNIIEYHEDDPATVEIIKEEFPRIKVIKHDLAKRKFIFHDD